MDSMLARCISESSGLFDERSPYSNFAFDAEGDQVEEMRNPPLYTLLDHVLWFHSSQSVNLSSQTGDSESWTHDAETTSIPLSHTTLTLIWTRWLPGAFSESSSLFGERSPYCNSTFDQGEDPCNPPPYRFLDHVLQVHSQSDSQSVIRGNNKTPLSINFLASDGLIIIVMTWWMRTSRAIKQRTYNEEEDQCAKQPSCKLWTSSLLEREDDIGDPRRRRCCCPC